jgi:hypothetical protein
MSQMMVAARQAPTFDDVLLIWGLALDLFNQKLASITKYRALLEEEISARPWRGTMYGIPRLSRIGTWSGAWPIGWDDPTHRVLLSREYQPEDYASWLLQALKKWLGGMTARFWYVAWGDPHTDKLRRILIAARDNINHKRKNYLSVIKKLRKELNSFSLTETWPIIVPSLNDLDDLYAHPGGAEPPLLTALLNGCLAEIRD